MLAKTAASIKIFENQFNSRVNELVGNLVKEFDEKKMKEKVKRKMAMDYSLMMFGEEEISVDIRSKLSVNVQ